MNDDWQPPDDIEPEAEPADTAQLPKAKGPPGIRSRADDVLDAVAGRRIGGPLKTCPSCNGEQFRVIVPLEGGVATRLCLKCRKAVPWASMSSPLITDEHRMGAARPGPFASEPPPPPESLDPFTPTYRKKSRSI
jgi:hypothetical protein